MSPALSRSSAIQRFERSNAIEVRDRITFDATLTFNQLDRTLGPSIRTSIQKGSF